MVSGEFSDSSDEEDFDKFQQVENKILDARFGLKIDLKELFDDIISLKITKKVESLVIPFLVKLLEGRENQNELISNEKISGLISKICGRISQGNQTSSFTLSSGEYVLKESSYTEAEIGFQTWGAGILLAKMIDRKEIDVRGKDILELGSGTGLAGLVCAKMGANQVVMTDYHPVVIENANINIKLNNLQDNAVCVNLDWRWSLGEKVID
jgi:2-polyprenyl-3-methyl-5-hydroxy-6-metoxy-1,4-benzoquinol methylase